MRKLASLNKLTILAAISLSASCSHNPVLESDSTTHLTPTSTLDVVVEKGDSLFSLGHKHGTDWHTIYKLNKQTLKAEGGLWVGQKLKVPHLQSTPPLALSKKLVQVASLDNNVKLTRSNKAQTGSEHENLEGDLPEGFPDPEFDSPHQPSTEQTFTNDATEFAWPINGFVTSYFGKRGRRFHKGIDIRGKIGTPIFSASSGQVLFTRHLRGYGKTVVVDHGDFLTLYAHCSKFKTQAGLMVAEGELLAHVGMTGNSRGPHLHFEIRDAKKRAIDPFPLLTKKLAQIFGVAEGDVKLAQLFEKLLKSPQNIIAL